MKKLFAIIILIPICTNPVFSQEWSNQDSTIVGNENCDAFNGLGAWNVKTCIFADSLHAEMDFWNGEKATAEKRQELGWTLTIKGWLYSASYSNVLESWSNNPVVIKRTAPPNPNSSLSTWESRCLYNGKTSVAYLPEDADSWPWVQADGIIRNLYGLKLKGKDYKAWRPKLKNFQMFVVYGRLLEMKDERLERLKETVKNPEIVGIPNGYYDKAMPDNYYYSVDFIRTK